MTTTCVVQARTGSTRLPGKVLADLDGVPLLRYMLERLAGLPVDTLVVATSDLPQDDPVQDLAATAGASVVRGPERDVLARFALALDTHPADTVVRLTADCPLVDPQVVMSVVALLDQADYACNVLPRTFPRGLDVEAFTGNALQIAHAEATDPIEREHVTPFLYRRPERFQLVNLRSGLALGRESWTVDTASDLEFVRTVAATMGRRDFGWRDVLDTVGTRVTPAPGEVWLRPAENGDAERVLAWRNDPASVATSETGTAVDETDHLAWFARRLADPGTKLWIGELDGAPVGMVRIDVRSGEGTVSVAVDPDRRGEGIGTRLLGAMITNLAGDCQVTSLIARIRPDNLASIKAFERNGFAATADDGDMRVYRWPSAPGDAQDAGY